MKSGPKPQSLEQLQEKGTYRKSRHSHLTEIDRAPMDVPVRPDDMPESAIDVWDSVIEQAVNCSGLGSLDSQALGNYCKMQAFINCQVAIGEMPPASYFGEARKMQEILGLCGPRSRIGLVVDTGKAQNKFTRGRK